MPDFAKCLGQSDKGACVCEKRDLCLRYTIISDSYYQSYLVFPGCDGCGDCEYFIPVDEVEGC